MNTEAPRLEGFHRSVSDAVSLLKKQMRNRGEGREGWESPREELRDAVHSRPSHCRPLQAGWDFTRHSKPRPLCAEPGTQNAARVESLAVAEILGEGEGFVGSARSRAF